MRIAPLADVKARLSAYLDNCGVEGPIVITRNGKPAGVLLVPYDDDDLERLMLGRSPRFQALLDRSRQSIKEGKGLAEEALWGGRSQTSASTKGRRSERPPKQTLRGGRPPGDEALHLAMEDEKARHLAAEVAAARRRLCPRLAIH